MVLTVSQFEWTWSKESEENSGVNCHSNKNRTTTNFKGEDSIGRGRGWAGITPPSSTVNVSRDLIQWDTAKLTTEERDPYSGKDKCGDTESMKVMWRPPSRTGRHSATNLGWTMDTASQEVQLRCIFVFPSSCPLAVWAPWYLFTAHHWIRATQRCWRGECSSTCSQSPRAFCSLCLVQRNGCLQEHFGYATSTSHETNCTGVCIQWQGDTEQWWIPAASWCQSERQWIVHTTNSEIIWYNSRRTSETSGGL